MTPTHRPVVETRRVMYPKDLYDPKKWLNFVQLPAFVRRWKSLGLSDDDLRGLEMAIIMDPMRPPQFQGAKGVRKIRFSPVGWDTGKSGGLRIAYAFFPEFGLVVLITVYAKPEIENLSPQQLKQITVLIEEIAKYLKGSKRS